MPELPEVETIVRELRRAVSGKTLKRVFIFDKRLCRPKIKLPQKIKGVRRRGKYIILDLANGGKLVFHLRMTGQFFFEKLADRRGLWRGAPARTNAERDFQPKQKHERARLVFQDGLILRFFDARRFGTLNFHKNEGTLPGLGVEPLSREFTGAALYGILRRTSRPVKTALLDQKLIAGIGNIYADEALWTAKISPKKKAKAISEREAWKLADAIKRILREAIKKGGFTLRDYKRLDGSSGYYQRSRKVYDREGLPCLPRAGSRGKRCRATPPHLKTGYKNTNSPAFRCGGKIKRIKIGGRSSYFCPSCQK